MYDNVNHKYTNMVYICMAYSECDNDYVNAQQSYQPMLSDVKQNFSFLEYFNSVVILLFTLFYPLNSNNIHTLCAHTL